MTIPEQPLAASYCDHCGEYAEPGTTRPYTEDRRYRACPRCVAKMLEEADPDETEGV